MEGVGAHVVLIYNCNVARWSFRSLQVGTINWLVIDSSKKGVGSVTYWAIMNASLTEEEFSTTVPHGTLPSFDAISLSAKNRVW